MTKKLKGYGTFDVVLIQQKIIITHPLPVTVTK